MDDFFNIPFSIGSDIVKDVDFVSYDTKPDSPALVQITTLQQAFDLMNERLFDSELPVPMINQANRNGSYGHFAADRWKSKGKDGATLHEININPYGMENNNKEILAVLVHEMVHLWQECLGDPSRAGYHNREWAEKMVSIGLRPVCLDPDRSGQFTGQRMHHEIIKGGKYDRLFKESRFRIAYFSSDKPKVKAIKERKNKTKYTCAGCGVNIWGKPELNVRCNNCGIDFEEQASQSNKRA